MCGFAKEFGYCPMGVAGAAKKVGVWCGDFSKQSECGNQANQDISVGQINFKITRPTTSTSPMVDGMHTTSNHRNGGR